jgi:aldose sugar dehydrogenase
MKYLIRRCVFSTFLLLCVHAIRAQEYRVDTLATDPGTSLPVTIAFTPDNSGRFFFTEKNAGRIRVYEPGVLRQKPFATVAVTTGGEQGLLGVTLHPLYPDSPFVYVYCTSTRSDRANILVRFDDSSGIGIVKDTLLIVPRVGDDLNNTNHNGGNIHFGPDGKLYVTIGDYGATAVNAQDTGATNYKGKILRLNDDGSIPPDNPFPGKPFWSIGHRNSFDFTWDSQTGKMYCSENGPACDDEVNVVPSGGNLGWPIEGNCTYTDKPNYVRPLYYFPNAPLPALTGIVIYRATAFPRLRGKILFAGNSTPNIWTLDLTAGGDTAVANSLGTFLSYGGGGFADIEVGPHDGNLYITNGPYTANRLLRVRPVAPAFTSTPPLTATQGVRYVYTPTFSGTPPGLSILAGPNGMYVDSTTWSVRWIPTNAQALQQSSTVSLMAENGDGNSIQNFTIAVTNVNDPPGPFNLISPPNDTTFSFVGGNPAMTFIWEAALDPDLDTVRYVLQIDTTATFNSPALKDTSVGTSTSATVNLPRHNRYYYWRVMASDGHVSVTSLTYGRVLVTFATQVRQTKEKEFILEQNFPNPFNPTTSIKYTIPKSGHVRLAVFNLLGQMVSLVFEGFQNAGTYEFEFQRAELPSGIYFYRIQAPDFVETKKMIVTK